MFYTRQKLNTPNTPTELINSTTQFGHPYTTWWYTVPCTRFLEPVAVMGRRRTPACERPETLYKHETGAWLTRRPARSSSTMLPESRTPGYSPNRWDARDGSAPLSGHQASPFLWRPLHLRDWRTNLFPFARETSASTRLAASTPVSPSTLCMFAPPGLITLLQPFWYRRQGQLTCAVNSGMWPVTTHEQWNIHWIRSEFHRVR